MPEAGSLPVLEVHRLGRLPYGAALRLQGERVAQRREGAIPDQLLLLEHPHVITLGRSSKADHVRADPDELARLGVEVHEVGRGGDVTYHGPGQLVGYPIVQLREGEQDLHQWLRTLEELLIRTLAVFGLEGQREEGRTGVWIGTGKVAAIGVRVSSGWITSHGFALNVRPDLGYFGTIVPCGIPDRPVTSMAEALGDGTVPAMDRIEEVLSGLAGPVLGRLVREGRRAPVAPEDQEEGGASGSNVR